MVGEACLPSNAYFAWTPEYTRFFCLFVRTFLILLLCISTLCDISKYDFGMLTSDSFVVGEILLNCSEKVSFANSLLN